MTLGRSSILLLAEHLSSQKTGVLKLNANLTEENALSLRSQAHAHLPSGYFPEIWEEGQIHGVSYVWMEEIQGWSLYDLIQTARVRQENLSPGLALALMRKMAKMLASLEAIRTPDFMPFLGRLTPGSVRLMSDGSIRFPGLCHLQNLPLSGSALTALPQEGPVVLAPEQVEEHRATPGTDIYGWALSSYMLLTGENPFVRKAGMSVARKAIREPVSMGPIEKKFPVLAQLFQAAFHPNPDQRPSALEVVRQLNQIEEKEASGDQLVCTAANFLGAAQPMRAGATMRQRCLGALERIGVPEGMGQKMLPPKQESTVKTRSTEIVEEGPIQLLEAQTLMPVKQTGKSTVQRNAVNPHPRPSIADPTQVGQDSEGEELGEVVAIQSPVAIKATKGKIEVIEAQINHQGASIVDNCAQVMESSLAPAITLVPAMDREPQVPAVPLESSAPPVKKGRVRIPAMAENPSPKEGARVAPPDIRRQLVREEAASLPLSQKMLGVPTWSWMLIGAVLVSATAGLILAHL